MPVGLPLLALPWTVARSSSPVPRGTEDEGPACVETVVDANASTGPGATVTATPEPMTTAASNPHNRPLWPGTVRRNFPAPATLDFPSPGLFIAIRPSWTVPKHVGTLLGPLPVRPPVWRRYGTVATVSTGLDIAVVGPVHNVSGRRADVGHGSARLPNIDDRGA